MPIKLRQNSRLRHALGEAGTDLLEYGLAAITRILPHTQDLDWTIGAHQATSITWASPARRELHVTIALEVEAGYSVTGTVRRRTIPQGVGRISRTLDLRERDICTRIVERLSRTLSDAGARSPESLGALRSTFDEWVVADHLVSHHRLALDLQATFTRLRTLAEQSYENKPLTFGCIIDGEMAEVPPEGAEFPRAYLTQKKKYRALSD